MIGLDPAWDEFDDLEIIPRGWGPDDELEVAELGDRVSLWFTNSLAASIYSTLPDRILAVTLNMVGAVAQRTSHRGQAFPGTWLPDEESS